MPTKVLHHLFNTGVVDEDKQHRVDLEKLRLAADDQTNMLCDSVGKMFFRPAFGFKGANKSNAKARLISFIAGEDDAFSLEITGGYLRVRDNDSGALVTRATVTAAVTSGDFSASTGWTLASTSGQSSTISGGELLLSARAKGAEARATQTLTINQVGTQHALEINVTRGPVTFRLGSTSGGDELISETTLLTGYHSLAFTPLGSSAYIQFSSKLPIIKKISSCVVAAAGAMSLPTPWAEADLGLVRFDQSLDVMFLAARGYKQKRIERRGDASWSVVDFDADDGPFLVGRTSDVKLTPSVIEGNGTLTASRAFFNAGHVGALFYLYHEGQRLDTYLAGANQFTDTIKITGVNETNYNDRDFTYSIAGTWAGKVKVGRSFDSELTGFQEFRKAQATADIDITSNVGPIIDDDNEDNVIAWYRLGIADGDYTSGEVHITVQYGGGGGFGICRVVGFTSATEVDIEVLTPFKGNYAVDDWREGAWSGVQGYPSAVTLADGRLFWAGDDRVWGSISDAFSSYDETFEGDAGPLARAIAVGGRNEARWMLPMSAIVVGTDARVAAVVANSLGDTITPTNLRVVPQSKVGVSKDVNPVLLANDRALFVEAAGRNIYELSLDPNVSKYIATPFSKLTTDLFASGIVEMAASTLPDQRVWVVTNDGVVCIVYEPEQKVVAFIPIQTTPGDLIESICVLPGVGQDRIRASIRREVNGQTVRYTEDLALDTQVRPDTLCMVCDSYITFGAGTPVLTGLDHLIGRDVMAWVDGAPDPRTYSVNGSGSITLLDTDGNPRTRTAGAVVGVPYYRAWESARLEYGPPQGTPVGTIKSIASVGFLFADYVRSGIEIGTRYADGRLSATTKLHAMLEGKVVTDVVVGVSKPQNPAQAIPGGASVDQRLRLTGGSPYPVSVLALVLAVETYGG